MSKCFILKYEEGRLVGRAEPGCKSVVVVPRDRIYADRVTIPALALENGQEAAVYQAERLFGVEGLKARFLPIEEKEETVEALLVAMESALIEEIKSLCMERRLDVAGISLASLVIATEKGVEEGMVRIDYGDYHEVAVIKSGRLRDVYMIPAGTPFPCSEGLIEVSYSDLPVVLPRCPDVLFPLGLSFSSSRNWKRIAGFACMAALLSFSWWNYSRLLEKKREFQRLSGRLSKMRRLSQSISTLKEKKKALEQKIKELERVEKGVSPIKILARLSKSVPDGTLLVRFNLDNNRVSIEGYTPSFSKLVEQLEKAGWIESLKITRASKRMERGPYQGMESFALKLKLKEQR